MTSLRLRNFLLTAGFTLAALAFSPSASADEMLRVQRLSFPVTLSDGSSQEVVGYLYCEAHCQGRPLQVLVHGATTTHLYWDLPDFGPGKYSYVRYMARKGYALLAIDQLGTGESSKPNGDFLTLDELARSLHQVTGQLRSGNNALHARFETVVAVGHSMGSSTVTYTQGTYHDFDAIVTTSIGHVPHTIPVSPEVIQAALSSPYWQFPVEDRIALTYYAPATTPSAILFDRLVNNQPLTRGEFFTVIAGSFDPVATRVGQVQGSVLVLLGDHDAEFPSAFAPGEESYWTSASDVTVREIQNTGHAMNAHQGRHQAWALTHAFFASRLHGHPCD